jgi:hypothetical protein
MPARVIPASVLESASELSVPHINPITDS